MHWTDYVLFFCCFVLLGMCVLIGLHGQHRWQMLIPLPATIMPTLQMMVRVERRWNQRKKDAIAHEIVVLYGRLAKKHNVLSFTGYNLRQFDMIAGFLSSMAEVYSEIRDEKDTKRVAKLIDHHRLLV